MSQAKFATSTTQVSEDLRAKTATLAEALPYMRMHAGQTFVVKYGGHAMGEEHLAMSFARDIVLLKQVGMNPVVVHGGGPQIGKMLERLKIKSEFVDGLRVTDAETVEIVEMVLSGTINKEIVAAISAAGGTAVGLSGKDGHLIQARKLTRSRRDPDYNNGVRPTRPQETDHGHARSPRSAASSPGAPPLPQRRRPARVRVLRAVVRTV